MTPLSMSRMQFEKHKKGNYYDYYSLYILTIFLQERLFNTKLMSIFHRTLIFKKFDCAIMLESVPGTNPVLANDGNVSCSRKQQEPLMELTLTSNQIQVRPCYPLLHCITSPLWFYKHRA